MELNVVEKESNLESKYIYIYLLNWTMCCLLRDRRREWKVRIWRSKWVNFWRNFNCRGRI